MATKSSAPKVPVALPRKEDVASPVANGPPLLAPEEALKTAIGARLRIKTAYSSTPLEGYLHTADAQLNLLMLWNTSSSTPTNTTLRPFSPLPPAGSIKVIFLNQIQSFQILTLPSSDQTFSIPETTTPTIDTTLTQARLERAIRAEQEKIARKGPKGTSPSEQALFEALARTMPARWEGSKMVISDHYTIEKPYNATNVGLADEKVGKAGLERIRRIVDMERSKINLKMGTDITGGGVLGGSRGTPKKGG